MSPHRLRPPRAPLAQQLSFLKKCLLLHPDAYFWLSVRVWCECGRVVKKTTGGVCARRCFLFVCLFACVAHELAMLCAWRACWVLDVCVSVRLSALVCVCEKGVICLMCVFAL